MKLFWLLNILVSIASAKYLYNQEKRDVEEAFIDLENSEGLIKKELGDLRRLYSKLPRKRNNDPHHSLTTRSYEEWLKNFKATEQPYTSTWRPYTSTMRPYTSTWRPYTSTMRPYTSTRQPYTSTMRPYTSTWRPYTSTMRPYTSTWRPYTSTWRPYTSTW